MEQPAPRSVFLRRLGLPLRNLAKRDKSKRARDRLIADLVRDRLQVGLSVAPEELPD